MNEYEEEIVKQLKSEDGFDLGMRLLISQLDYKRGLEILRESTKYTFFLRIKITVVF